MIALAFILWALVVTLVDGVVWACRHGAAKRRARNEVWPPRQVLEVTLDDRIPF